MTASAPITDLLRVEEGFPLHALPRLWQWMQAVWDKVADDFSPADYDSFESEWCSRAEFERRWAVYLDDRLGGLITIEEVSPLIASIHVIFSKTFWGHEVTRPALVEVLRKVFEANERLLKVQAVTFHNGALIALAKSLGFEREGRLRKQTLQHGQPVDMFVLGLTREDFYQCHGQQLAPESAQSPAR